MPRRNRRRWAEPLRMPLASVQRTEQWRGEDYVVRTVTAAAAAKPYRCPGCDQLLRIGMPHVVTWPTADPDAGDRRHWHSPCWAARDTRGPGNGRGRSAPRY